MWCIPQVNSDFLERMEDLLNLYKKPLNSKEPVVCLDEKPVQMWGDAHRPIPAGPGRIAKQDYEYRRGGTANVYCIVEPKAGRHFAEVTPNRKKTAFAKTLRKLATQRYPRAKKIHLVVDNLSGHGKRALLETFGARQGERLWLRFQFHYTPKHGSWLNQAEIEISLFRRQCLGKERVPDLTELKHRATAWAKRMTRKRLIIHWRFTTVKARKLFRYQKVASIRPDD
jgi:hypothetical protein